MMVTCVLVHFFGLSGGHGFDGWTKRILATNVNVCAVGTQPTCPPALRFRPGPTQGAGSVSEWIRAQGQSADSCKSTQMAAVPGLALKTGAGRAVSAHDPCSFHRQGCWWWAPQGSPAAPAVVASSSWVPTTTANWLRAGISPPPSPRFPVIPPHASPGDRGGIGAPSLTKKTLRAGSICWCGIAVVVGRPLINPRNREARPCAHQPATGPLQLALCVLCRGLMHTVPRRR